jgi:hypothetical protein
MKIRPVRAEFFQANGRTWKKKMKRREEADGRFSKFCKRA